MYTASSIIKYAAWFRWRKNSLSTSTVFINEFFIWCLTLKIAACKSPRVSKNHSQGAWVGVDMYIWGNIYNMYISE